MFSYEASILNSVKYLYLRGLSEPSDNSPKIVVQEAIANHSRPLSLDPHLDPYLVRIREGRSLIESTEACRSFELYWEHYVAYLVTEECAGSCGNYKDEEYAGQLFRIYSKSHFLDHISRNTGAHAKPVQHYKVACLNHLIDIGAYEPPQIRLIEPGNASFRIH